MKIGEILAAFDAKKRTHIVIAVEDFVKYINSGAKAAFLLNDLKDIQDGRKADGKEPDPKYIVIEVGAPYAEEVVEVLRRYAAQEGATGSCANGPIVERAAGTEA